MSSNQPNNLIKLKKVKWVSHRGLARAVDENTIAAFQAAKDAGFNALETDLRTSKDGQLVLCHDESFERLGGPRVPVWEFSANAITKIKLKRGGSPATFVQLMDKFGDDDWTFDIKPEQGDRTVRFLISHIKTDGWRDRIASGQYRFLFWHPKHQARFLEAFPEAQCYARADEIRKVGVAYILKMAWMIKPKADKVYALPPTYKGIQLFDESILKYFHDNGAKVCAFLPETEAQTEAALRLGFDEILTNDTPIS